MHLSAHSKFLFIGDSITDTGRDPSGEETPWAATSFGKGYVNLVNAWLLSTFPHSPIRIINQGCSGHTVLDLKNRWQKDVLDHQPDWVAVMIGINDVWRQFDVPLQKNKHVLPDIYEKTLDELLTQTRPQLQGLILATPFFIESNKDDSMRKRMDEYGAIVKKLAAKHQALFIDTQAAFDAVLQHSHSSSLAWDRIHPTTVGHMVIAKEFLKTIQAL
ncbi:MAG: SGNH/GDSL hydrolase family protein [Verrucomicrobiota bacterium]